MSARAPRKKPARKAAPPPAVVTPATAEKSTRGTPAQQKAPSKPLLTPDAASAPQLWADFATTARKLYDHSVSAPETVDFLQLHSVIQWLFAMLRKNSKVGGSKAEEAVRTLHWLARFGAAFLVEASKDEKSRETLKAVAAANPDWPVLLSLRPSSYAKAKAYLADIGVGTASIPPTATMRDDFEHRWRELAETLIYKIKMTRSLLKKRSIPKIQKSLENELSEANKWKQVLDYPPQLNKQTASKWWEVAGKMLKVHWEAHPVEKKADFEKVKKSAEAAGETSEAYAHRQVRIIFHSLAAKGDKGNDER